MDVWLFSFTYPYIRTEAHAELEAAKDARRAEDDAHRLEYRGMRCLI